MHDFMEIPGSGLPKDTVLNLKLKFGMIRQSLRKEKIRNCCAQLKKLDGFTARRRANFDTLLAALRPYEDRLILPSPTPGSEPSSASRPETPMPINRNGVPSISRCNRLMPDS